MVTSKLRSTSYLFIVGMNEMIFLQMSSPVSSASVSLGVSDSLRMFGMS